jgi:hypothetical protein
MYLAGISVRRVKDITEALRFSRTRNMSRTYFLRR